MKWKSVGNNRGFALPTVLITSVVMLMLLLAGMVTATSTNTSVRGQYHDQLAKEAAEAGVSLMIGCVRANGSMPSTGTWKPDSTSCTNAAVDTGKSPYVMDTYSNGDASRFRSWFEVAAPTDSGNGYYDINSVGYVTLYRGTSGVAATTLSRTVNLKIQYQSLFPSNSSSGSAFVCAILSGQTYCWGRNDSAETGSGVISSTPTYYGTTGNPQVAKTDRTNLGTLDSDVTAGGDFACNITNKPTGVGISRYNYVYCWGLQTNGRLGNGYGGSSTALVTIPGGPATAGANTGNNNWTQRGVVGDISGGWPTRVESGLNFACSQLSISPVYPSIYCWGSNGRGQLGTGTPNDGVDRNTPTQTWSQSDTNAGINAYGLNAGGANACAILSSNNVLLCWGDNGYNQLGDVGITAGKSPYPRQVRYSDNSTFKATDVAITSFVGDTGHACAISADGTSANINKVWCWGSDYYGQIGDSLAGGTTTVKSPKKVSFSGDSTTYTAYDVAVSTYGSCALVKVPPSTTKEVYCWGNNTQGELGRNLDPNISGNDQKQVPGKVYEPFTGFHSLVKSLEGGGRRICAVVGNSNYCWGLNHQGQIGDGTLGEDYSYGGLPARYKPTKSKFLEPLYTGISY